MDAEVTNIEILPSEIRGVRSSLCWRADLVDISTALFKGIPENFLASVVRNGGASAAICFAIYRVYPDALLRNFRSAGDSGMKFTIDKGGRLLDDVKAGRAGDVIGTFLKNLPTSLADEYYNLYENGNQLRFRLSPQNSDNLESTHSKATAHKEMHSEPTKSTPADTTTANKPKATENQRSTTEATNLRTTDTQTVVSTPFMFDLLSLAEDDAHTLWESKDYKQALPLFEKCMDSVAGNGRTTFLLKFAFTLRHCGRLDDSMRYFSDAIRLLKETAASGDEFSSNFAESIREIGERYAESSAYSRAAWVYNCSADIFERCRNADSGATGILNCMTGLQNMDIPRFNEQLTQFARQSLIRLTEMIDRIYRTRKCETWKLGTAYSRLGDDFSNGYLYDDKIRSLKKCLEVMEEGYGAGAQDHAVYGISSHNLAVEFLRMEKFEEAEVMFSKALERQKAAKDWSSDRKRDKCVNNTTRLLASTQRKQPI
ncbi:uncharacterized protein LOC108950279 [Ciona intestinalis]